MGNTENEFWKSTPKKILKLIHIHCKINNPDYAIAENKNENGSYITEGKKVLKCLD